MMCLLYRSGLTLAFFAVLLQIAVYVQPFLPAAYQVSPICETITRALLTELKTHHSMQHSQSDSDMQHHMLADSDHDSAHDHHSASHQCQYCTVHANLVLPITLGIKEIIVAIQVRLLFFKQHLAYIYFDLQRLFLLPQGRAPPVFV